MKRYFRRKILIYVLTFFVAVTIDWMIPRFMPGNPILNLLSRAGSAHSEANQIMYTYLTKAYGLDLPLWKQYINFWVALFHWDFGISFYLFPKPVVKIISDALPFDLALLLPAILLSWIAGNAFGAVAARTKRLDSTVLPLGYILSATPYMWLAIVLSWAFGIVFKIFPYSGAYSYSMVPHWSWAFAWDVLRHWVLPFLSLFVVMFGGWAIGMRNMIIYELEADYAHYMQALGAPKRMVRNYAFRNALLPQLSGLALQLGAIVAGAMATEIVFSYPGLGYLILQAIQNQDYFLLQGCFFFIILGVLAANFLIDIVFIIVDPRTRKGMTGGAS